MLEPNVRHFYVKINNSFVHLVQYGHTDEDIVKSAESLAEQQQQQQQSSLDSIEELKSDTNSGGAENKINKLIVFVPGNPGVLGVYHDFLVQLYKQLCKPSDKGSGPVLLAIGHNNFDHPNDADHHHHHHQSSVINISNEQVEEEEEEPHSIELQYLNKLIILKRLVKINFKKSVDATDSNNGHCNSSGCELVFVGHSMGCYIILKLLQDKVLAAASVGSILVHPALENLASTEKGALVAQLFALKFDLLVRLVAYGLDKLVPKSVLVSSIGWLYCPNNFISSSSSIVVQSMLQLLRPFSLNALIEMAKSELTCMKDLNHSRLIKPHAGKLTLIYAKNDAWVNRVHRLELAQLYANLHIEEHETMHAFIMDPQVVAAYSIKFAMLIDDFFDSSQASPHCVSL